MRVLQLSGGCLSPAPGGAERCCLELSQWLAASGIDVLIAAPARADEQPFEPMVSLQPMRWKPLRKLIFDYISPENARRLRRIIAGFQPDVVHVHNIYGVSSQLIRIASGHAPTIVTVHDYWPVDVFVPRVTKGRLQYPHRQRLLSPWVQVHRALHRRNLRGATLVSPSRYLARRLQQFGYRDVRVIPNGVELPEEITAADPSVLFVGRLVPEKGLQDVLRPLADTAHELGWRIDIAGDGPLRARLERQVPSARFHGPVDPTPLYRHAGIVVMPSRWPENFPYVALEAMSYGVPVLASAVGGIPEIVEDGVTGRLYDPDDRDQFVGALRQLARDRGLRERLGRAAREHIAREFTWAVTGPRYLALYQERSPAQPRSGAKVPAV